MRQANQTEKVFAGLSVFLIGGIFVGSTWTYAIHAIVFLCACWLLVRNSDWRTRTLGYFTSRKVIWGLLAGFAIAFALPFLFSPWSDLVDVSELKWILVILGLLMPAAAVLRSEGNSMPVRVATYLVVGLVLLSAVDGIIQGFTGKNPLREWMGASVDDFGGGTRRATGLLRNPIPFGHSMGAIFWISAAGVLVAWAAKRRKWMLIGGLLCFASFASVLFSQPRGAWFAIALVAVFSVPVLKGRARRFWLTCLGVACVVGILGVLLHGETSARLGSSINPSDASNNIRLELWQANYKILKDHPFGIGYNANDQLIEKAFDDLGFEHHRFMGHSHNEFVEIAVGSGWLGIGLYLVVTLWLLWLAIEELRRLNCEENSWTAFLLLSSILTQLFINACALTDQLSTPGRFLLCYAWAVAIVVPLERKWSSA